MALLGIRETGHHITYGCHRAPRGCAMILKENEKQPLTVDFSNVLGAATIASVAYNTDGLTVAATSNTTTTATLQLNGQVSGSLTVEATDSDGNVHVACVQVNAQHNRDRYNLAC